MQPQRCIDGKSAQAISLIDWASVWKAAVQPNSAFVETCGIFRVSASPACSMEIERWFWTHVNGSELCRDIGAEIDILNGRYSNVEFVKMLQQ